MVRNLCEKTCGEVVEWVEGEGEGKEGGERRLEGCKHECVRKCGECVMLSWERERKAREKEKEKEEREKKEREKEEREDSEEEGKASPTNSTANLFPKDFFVKKTVHAPCKHVCDRELSCGHRCGGVCHPATHCPPCQQKCGS